MSIERTPEQIAQFHSDMERIATHRVSNPEADQLLRLRGTINDLLDQRDELLAACKAWVEPSEPHIDLAQAWKMAQAAIARAEGRDQ